MSSETFAFLPDPHRGHCPPPSSGVFLLICAVVHCYFRFFDHFWLIFALFAGMSRETFPFLADPHRGHPPPPFPGVFLFLWPVVHYYFRFFPHHFWLIFALFTGMSTETSSFLTDPHRGHLPPPFPGVFLFICPVVYYYFRFFHHFWLILPFLQAWSGRPPLLLLNLIRNNLLHHLQVCSSSLVPLLIIIFAFFDHFWLIFALFAGMSRGTFPSFADPRGGDCASSSAGVFKWCLHIFQCYFIFIDHFWPLCRIMPPRTIFV